MLDHVKEWAESYLIISDPTMQLALEADRRYWLDKCRQGLLNNLWDNNPGELERWADDGGRVLDGSS